MSSSATVRALAGGVPEALKILSYGLGELMRGEGRHGANSMPGGRRVTTAGRRGIRQLSE